MTPGSGVRDASGSRDDIRGTSEADEQVGRTVVATWDVAENDVEGGMSLPDWHRHQVPREEVTRWHSR